MTAIPGELKEWYETETGGWARTDHPESGVIYVRPPKTFEEYYFERAEPDVEPVRRDLEAELDALLTRVVELEAKDAVRTKNSGDLAGRDNSSGGDGDPLGR